MQTDLTRAIRNVAFAILAAVDAYENEMKGADVKGLAPTSGPVSRLRELKEKNVSWRQLRRGASSILGIGLSEASAADRSHAKRVCQKAGLSPAELLSILETNKLGIAGHRSSSREPVNGAEGLSAAKAHP